MTSKHYYAVTAKCGHVGRNRYIPIVFPIIAESAKEAASIVRKLPRVKHHHKNAILECRMITESEYNHLIAVNDSDNYLKVQNKQEQKIYCPDLERRIIQEIKTEKTLNKDRVVKKLKRQKELEKSFQLECQNCYI